MEQIYLLNQLSLMVDTGVPVAEALEGILRQTPRGVLHAVLTDLLRRVEAGEPLSQAMSAHPRVFAALTVNLVRASEMSGRLGEALGRIATYMTRQREIISKVRGALIYPIILTLMSVGMVIFLMTYLLPKFLIIYRGRMDLLPTPTRFLAGISTALASYWPWWVGSVVVAAVSVAIGLRTATGRRVGDVVALHTPLLGTIYHKSLLARATQTMGTLIASGVSMLDTVAITRRVTGNHAFRALWDNVEQALQQGKQLSAPLYESSLLPRPVVQMIESGERSGQLGKVLARLAAHFEEELYRTIQHSSKLIEPALIVIMGTVVGAIATAMLLPILSMSKVVGM